LRETSLFSSSSKILAHAQLFPFLLAIVHGEGIYDLDRRRRRLTFSHVSIAFGDLENRLDLGFLSRMSWGSLALEKTPFEII
jgi:hypothetical protein